MTNTLDLTEWEKERLCVACEESQAVLSFEKDEDYNVVVPVWTCKNTICGLAFTDWRAEIIRDNAPKQ